MGTGDMLLLFSVMPSCEIWLFTITIILRQHAKTKTKKGVSKYIDLDRIY